jgi:ABC-type transport system involved in multi-copper enzyme maturation permease subunit
MKFLAILKDSLRETIDTKVFVVVLVISALIIAGLATLSLKPDPPDTAFQKLTERFPDGSAEVELPIVGRVKATPSLVHYSVQDIKVPEDNSRPWEGEYRFVVEARDEVPLGGRIAIRDHTIKDEEEKERAANTGQPTRSKQLEEDIGAEYRRIEEREKAKGGGRMEVQRRVQEQLLAYILKRMEDEVRAMPDSEMEQFVREELENQGNWHVAEVKHLDLPLEERTIKIKVKVPVQDGDDVRITNKEMEGEVNKYQVKVVSRTGTYRLWPHKATLLFGAIPWGDSAQPGQLVYRLSYWLLGWVGAPLIMLLSCIITAFFIPNMLRKGTIDLLLAKPISRVGLMVYKYAGGMLFMLLNTIVLIGGMWLVLGWRGGIWELAFLLTIPVLTYQFALFYALSTLAAVWSRSPIVSILACVLLYGVLFGVGNLYWIASAAPEMKGKVVPEWAYTTVETAHAVLPHYLDLVWLNDLVIKDHVLDLPQAEQEKEATKNKMFNWGESLAVTSLYTVVLLGLACWRFAAKDY